MTQIEPEHCPLSVDLLWFSMVHQPAACMHTCKRSCLAKLGCDSSVSDWARNFKHGPPAPPMADHNHRYALEFDWAAKNVAPTDPKKIPTKGQTQKGDRQPEPGGGAKGAGGGAMPTDWTTPRLMKQRTKHLRTILKEDFGDTCKGCKHKHEFVHRLQTHLRGGNDRDQTGAQAQAAPQRATDEL